MRQIDCHLLRTFPLPVPDDAIDKNARGRVLIAGGSPTSAGAVMLGGLAAFRAGAGKVMLAVPQSLAIAMAVGFPEAGVSGFPETARGTPDVPAAGHIAALLPGVDSLLVGPGLVDEASAQQLTLRLLESHGPAVVIDAAALTGLWGAGELIAAHDGPIVITPHAGEMAHLSGFPKAEVDADPLRIAQMAAERLSCVVVLKGPRTVVAMQGEQPFVFDGGNAGLATSGSGDVLAGLLAGLLARGLEPAAAACWAVFVHAQAGARLAERSGPVGFLARELTTEIPRLIHDLT